MVRHTLVQRIVKAYDRYNEMIGAGRQLALEINWRPWLPKRPASQPLRDTTAETPGFRSLI